MKRFFLFSRPTSQVGMSLPSKTLIGMRVSISLAVFSLILLALGVLPSLAQAQTCNLTQPLISVLGGNYTVAQMVTVVESDTNTVIYYTTNGQPAWINGPSASQSGPTPSAIKYSGPFEVSTSSYLLVVAWDSRCNSWYANSSQIDFTTAAQDFSISISPSSLTVDVGKTTTATVTVTPSNGFNNQIAFSCSQSSSVLCSFSPLEVTPSGSTTVQLTVVGLPQIASLHRKPSPFFPATALAGVLCLFGLRRCYRLRLMVLAMVAFASLGMLSACGGSSPTPVSPGTVTVTAQMTNVTISELQHTASISF